MESKPKVLVSKCLNFEKCRYDGSMIPFSFIETLKDHVEFITVCPEEEMGMGIPRPTIRLAEDKEGNRKLIQSKNGEDWTDQMRSFTQKFMERDLNFVGAIFKAKSPSCGMLGIKVYNEETGVPMSPSKGMFAEAVAENYPLLAAEEEGRLRDFKIREHFLIKLFTLHRFQKALESGKIKDLVKFQADHKYLFMCYNQELLREMGRAIAQIKILGFDESVGEYKRLLTKLLLRPAKTSNKINAFMHVFGYFKNELNSEEKSFFLEQIDLYRMHGIPFHSITMLLKAWTIKFGIKYLLEQELFSPFPKNLMTVRDSGKAVM